MKSEHTLVLQSEDCEDVAYVGVTSAYANSARYYIAAPGAEDGSPALIPLATGAPEAKTRSVGWRLFEIFGDENGNARVSVDGAKLSAFKMKGRPKRVLLRSGGAPGTTGAGGVDGAVNEQPALWDAVYAKVGREVIEGMKAQPFEQGAVKTRVTRYGAEWSKVKLPATAAAATSASTTTTTTSTAAIVATEEVSPGPRYAHAMAAAEERDAAYLFGGELAGVGAGGGLWRLDAAAARANAVGGYYPNAEAKAFGSEAYYKQTTTTTSSSNSSSPSPTPSPSSSSSAVKKAHWQHVRVVGVGPDGAPSPRRDATLVYVPSTTPGASGPRVILHGGRATSGTEPLKDAWSFDIHAETWTRLQDCPVPLYGHSTVIYGTRLWIFGGYDGAANSINKLWSYDLVSGRWAEEVYGGPTPAGRMWHTATMHGARMHVVGGMSSDYKEYLTWHELNLRLSTPGGAAGKWKRNLGRDTQTSSGRRAAAASQGHAVDSGTGTSTYYTHFSVL